MNCQGIAAALILVIEDDVEIRRFLRASLVAEGYRLHEAMTAADGVIQATSRTPDLIILDLGLPDFDGLEVIEKVRASSQVPILVLSARGQEKDKVAALDRGADDFVSKPFGVGELLARIRVALRHVARIRLNEPLTAFTTGELEVHLTERRVLLKGIGIHLTPIEFRLLQVLVQHAGKVVTHNHLLRDVWGPNSVREGQYLRVHVAQLRRKIEEDSSRPHYILTEPGVGYRLQVDE
jgi:two-component system, OmpR family, KDP operon response regulator KdpE